MKTTHTAASHQRSHAAHVNPEIQPGSPYEAHENEECYGHGIEKHRIIEVTAYYFAEKDGFRKTPEHYWLEAEKEIDLSYQ